MVKDMDRRKERALNIEVTDTNFKIETDKRTICCGIQSLGTSNEAPASNKY